MLHIALSSAPPSISVSLPTVNVTLFGSRVFVPIMDVTHVMVKGLMKLWDMQCRATQDEWVIVKSFQRMWSTGAENSNPLQILLVEHREQYGKSKRYEQWWVSSPGWKACNMLLGMSRKQLLIAPVGIKWLGQSRNDAQLWICLVVKVKSNAVRSNIAQEPGILGPWIKVT